MTSTEIYNKFTWKTFLITDIFTINNGKRLKKEDHINGIVPFISATEFNNGITNYITNDNKHNNCITLSYDGSIGNTFYQSNDCIVSDSCKVLKLKNKNLNKYIALFMCSSIEKLKDKYSYGKKLNTSRLKKETIWLPINDKDKIDFDSIEKYMSELELELGYSEDLYSIDNDKTRLELDSVKWNEFKVSDIFNIEICRSLDAQSDIEVGNDINYISRQSTNNGVQLKVKYPNDKYIYAGNCLTLAVVGEVGTTFYQEKEFCASQNIIRISSDIKLSKYSWLFITSCIEKLKAKYSYGKTLGKGRLENETIQLPITDDGNVNYKFMEDYMKSISFSEILD